MANKVIIIRNAYPHDFGGGERFPIFLANELRQNGVTCTVVSRNPKLLEFAESENIQTIRGWWWSRQSWNGWRVALFPVYALWQLVLYVWYIQLFARLQPDVVHIQSKDDFIAATMAARNRNIQIIWTDHADLKHVWKNLHVPLKNPIGKWVYRASKHADHITVVSESEKQSVLNNLPTGSPIISKIRVIYNGCADVYQKYKPTSPSNKKTTFLIANRLVTAKGIGETISAFRLLANKYPDTNLVIAGDGPEAEKFKAAASGIKNIKFIGHQSDPYETMASADIFLQPSYHEGFSVVLVEASMMKLPIIATSVGGNVEIIKDKETGLLVDPQNADKLYSAMELLITDMTLRNKLATNARQQYLDKFQFDKIVRERFMPLYDKTIN